MRVATTGLCALALMACGGGTTASRDVDVRVAMDTPADAFDERQADAYPVYIDLENSTDHVIRVDDVMARIAIERDGRTVCEDEQFQRVRMRPEDAVIPARSSRRVAATLPCGLARGDYDVVAELRFETDR